MFNKFSGHAQTAILRAKNEAKRLSHHRIDTEHLLLGLIREQGMAMKILLKLGLTPEQVQSEMETLLQGRPSTPGTGELLFTSEADKVMAFAMEESIGLHHNYIGTEHLFLGLIREEKGVAAQALKNLGLGVDQVRNAVRTILDASTQPSGPRNEEEEARQILDRKLQALKEDKSYDQLRERILQPQVSTVTGSVIGCVYEVEVQTVWASAGGKLRLVVTVDCAKSGFIPVMGQFVMSPDGFVVDG